MQFLHADGADAHFMDSESFEQIAVPETALADTLRWTKPSTEGGPAVHRRGARGPPNCRGGVDLVVSETDPGLRGDTASGGGTKPATLETGAIIQVPLFVEAGQAVRVDTARAPMSRVPDAP